MTQSTVRQLNSPSGETSPAHPGKHRAETQVAISPKKTCRCQQAHRKVLSITGHQENANQNHR